MSGSGEGLLLGLPVRTRSLQLTCEKGTWFKQGFDRHLSIELKSDVVP